MTTSRDPFGHWPVGSGYRVPRPEIGLLPLCSRCHQRHQGATPICNLTTPDEEPEDGERPE